MPHTLPQHRPTTVKPLIFLLISLVGALLVDISWLVKLFHSQVAPTASYHLVVFFIRIAWAFLIIQYQALELFLQSIAVKQFFLNPLNKLSVALSAALSGYFFYIAFFQYNNLATIAERNLERATTHGWEFFMMSVFVVYFLAFLMAKGLLLAYYSAHTIKHPKILRKQLWLFIIYLICPYLIIEFLLGFCFQIIYEMYFAVSISTLLLCYAIYYCLHNVIKLRFMNVKPHVQAPPKPQLIEDFKMVLDQLSKTSSLQELIHITQTFFKYAFQLPINSVCLAIRDTLITPEKASRLDKKEYSIEQFLSHHMDHADKKHDIRDTIFIYDEIAFNNFYQETNTSTTIIRFLDEIHSNIFLPIYSNKKIVAYITIDQDARHQLFSQAERDTIMVFSYHLGNIINLLQHKNINLLIHKEKRLKDNLYLQHQEINQYKESINVFLRRSKQKVLGIIFYKNGTFTLGNQDAKNIVAINLNLQDGHPMTKAFKLVANYVDTYKAPYAQHTKDLQGNQIIISGVVSHEKQNVILMITYPDIADVISHQKHLLHDPNDWDYLLYLTSTQAGTLINQLFPGTGELLLNFKIRLLKTALSRNALLLDLPQDDLLPTVRLLHTISLRETLHTIELNEPTTNSSISAQLFGTNTLSMDSKPLLQKLNNGTLFIKNIHFLDYTTQHYLTEIIYGVYRVFETDHKLPNTTRIICSTNQNLSQLVQEGLFAQELLTILKPTSLSLPSLMTMPKQELHSIITSFTDSFIKSSIAKTLFALTDQEMDKILEQQPSSIHELKKMIEFIIFKKSQDSPAYSAQLTSKCDDPVLIEASALGKQALKDPRIMTLLWQKLKTQNKIAIFLGVNRSSVNRRLAALGIRKQYNNREGVL